MRNKHFIRNWLILLGVVILGLFWTARVYWSFLTGPTSSSDKPVAFVVAKGEGGSTVADNLEKKGLIKSSLAMKITLKFFKTGVKIPAGDYKLSPNMSLDQIINSMSQGPEDRWVTLQEGWRREQMANMLKDELNLDKAAFLSASKGKEGYLFPDTYLFNKEATPETIVSTLANTFTTRYSPDLQKQIKAVGLTPDQGVVLASIVEREARSDKARTQVASILLKRLKIGMGLNADATVQYAKDSQAVAAGKPPAKFWQPVTQSDYQDIDSPFNTYLHAGLPPSPICNPSLSSLKAVANADSSTPYLYYYHDSQGNSYYATTLEEHNANVKNHP